MRQANVITVGRVVSVADGGFNLARNPRDHSQPASDIICPTTTYEVKVEHYLKGDAGAHCASFRQGRYCFPMGSRREPLFTSRIEASR